MTRPGACLELTTAAGRRFFVSAFLILYMGMHYSRLSVLVLLQFCCTRVNAVHLCCCEFRRSNLNSEFRRCFGVAWTVAW